MTDRTATPRQRRQVQRDRAAGIVRVTVKVPAKDAELIRRLAERCRIRCQIVAPYQPEPEPTA